MLTIEKCMATCTAVANVSIINICMRSDVKEIQGSGTLGFCHMCVSPNEVKGKVSEGRNNFYYQRLLFKGN